MKINKLRKEFDINIDKNHFKTSFDFNGKKSRRKESKQTQIKTNTNKVILLYDASNKLFQQTPKRDLTQSKAFDNIKVPRTIPQNKSCINVNKIPIKQDYKHQSLHLQLSNSLKLLNNTKQRYNTISTWQKEKESNTLKMINTTSTIQSTDDHRPHLIQNQKDSQQKDSVISKLNEQLSFQYIKVNKLETQLKNLNRKYKKIKEETIALHNNNLYYQNDLLRLKGENEALKQHQLKLMKVIYILKDKGIEIETCINQVFQGKYNSSIYYDNMNESLEDINFVNKIHYSTTHDMKSVPKLNFEKVYLYQNALIEHDDFNYYNHCKEESNQFHNHYYCYKTEENVNKFKGANHDDKSNINNKRILMRINRYTPTKDNHLN